MSFLELQPAVRHLRRVAKAHAAGEIPRQDYRRERRKIIEELHIDFADGGANSKLPIDGFTLGDDDTRRRLPVDAVEPSSAAIQTSTVVAPQIWPKVLAGLVLLVVLFGGLSAYAKLIPPVSDRDPNPKNSITLSLRTLEISDFEALPGIDHAELNEYLATLVAEARKDSGLSKTEGLTPSELAEFGDLLVRLGVKDDKGLDSSAVVALNALAHRQNGRRGVSVVQLERMAERVELYYRERGYLAARVFVPAQQIEDERAVLRVLPGRISRVELKTSSPLSSLARQAFGPQLNRAAQRSALEEYFYKLNSLPGVRASGNLSSGDAVGETTLNLGLENERRFVSSFSLDNLGDERSSRYRLRARSEWRNPLLRGDSLAISGALRVDPEDAVDFGVRYQLPGLKLGDIFSTSFAHSDFDVNPRSTDITIHGGAQTLSFGFQRLLLGSRTRSLSLGANASLQKLEFGSTQQRLWSVAPEVEAHRVLEESRWVLRGSTSVFAGRITSERFSEQSAGFVGARGSISAWKPFGRQFLRLQVSAQVGSEDLPDSQKFRLGGARRISAVRPGGFIADSALVAGIEVSATPSSLREYGQLEFFTRIGTGQVQISGDQESAFAWDGGILWRLPDTRPVTGALRLSVPLVTNGIEDSHDRARVLFDLAWRP